MSRPVGVRDPINRLLVEACQRHDGAAEAKLLAVFDDPAAPLDLQLEAGRRAFGIACLRKIARGAFDV